MRGKLLFSLFTLILFLKSNKITKKKRMGDWRKWYPFLFLKRIFDWFQEKLTYKYSEMKLEVILVPGIPTISIYHFNNEEKLKLKWRKIFSTKWCRSLVLCLLFLTLYKLLIVAFTKGNMENSQLCQKKEKIFHPYLHHPKATFGIRVYLFSDFSPCIHTKFLR